MNPDRLPLLMFALMGLVIVVIIGMATGSWAWFGAALLAHIVASTIVIRHSIGSAQTGTESDKKSQRLDQIAGETLPGDERNHVEELERLKREPAQEI